MKLIYFKMLNTAIERLLNNELAGYGLTYTQATVIGYLKQKEGQDICQKDIEASLGLTHPTVSSILHRMEEKGMIRTESREEDHRYKRITLTPASAQLVHDIRSRISGIEARLYAGLSEKELAVLDQMMQKMLHNI